MIQRLAAASRQPEYTMVYTCQPVLDMGLVLISPEVLFRWGTVPEFPHQGGLEHIRQDVDQALAAHLCATVRGLGLQQSFQQGIADA